METPFFLYCLVVFYLTSCVLTKNCDKIGILLYEDLGCIPHYVKSSNCPVSYSCQGLGVWKDQCHFRGKIYSDNEVVDENLSSLSCDKACHCSSFTTSSDFLCAGLDCPERLGHRRPSCFAKYSLNSCCSVGRICPSANDARCLVDGVAYKEGQKFRSKQSCNECVCEKGFKLEEPFCRRVACGIQLKYSRYVQNVCAPLYSKEFSKVRCCPNSWVCADETEVIMGESEYDNVCYFGKNTLKVGQYILKSRAAVYVKTAARIRCKCVIPPLLTCDEMY